MSETQAYWFSSHSTQQELSNEHQHDRVTMFSEYFCGFAPWDKVISALNGLKHLSVKET